MDVFFVACFTEEKKVVNFAGIVNDLQGSVFSGFKRL